MEPVKCSNQSTTTGWSVTCQQLYAPKPGCKFLFLDFRCRNVATKFVRLVDTPPEGNATGNSFYLFDHRGVDEIDIEHNWEEVVIGFQNILQLSARFTLKRDLKFIRCEFGATVGILEYDVDGLKGL
jgi:hypothetical protein